VVTRDTDHERHEEKADGIKSEADHATHKLRTRGHRFAMVLKLHAINNEQAEGFGDTIPDSSR